MQIPERKAVPWPEDASQEIMGSNPGAGKGFFLAKSLSDCTCREICTLVKSKLNTLLIVQSVLGASQYQIKPHQTRLK